MACPICGTGFLDGETCEQVKCLACSKEQCFSNGIRSGTCHSCHFGMLPGWLGNNNPDLNRTSVRCSYKGCGEMAVYIHLPGSKKIACKDHGDKILARRKRK